MTPAKREDTNMPAVLDTAALTALMTEVMRPVVECFGKMLENNTAAIEHMAAAQAAANERMAALDKDVRLNMPVTPKMASYLTAEIKSRAKAILEKRSLDGDKKAVTALSGAIRKSVLSRYGVNSLREIPKYEYNVAMSQIGMWNDMLVIRDVVNAARERAEREADHGEDHEEL